MDEKTTKQLAEAFDEMSELATKIAGIFRGAAGGGKGASVDGKAGGKPAATKRAASKVEKEDDDELTEDSCREALAALAESHGKEVMLSALRHVGAAKLADVDESQYSDLMEKVQELAASAADEPPAKATKATKKTTKKAVTAEDVVAAGKALIAADRDAAKKVLKSLGSAKFSEIEDDFDKALAAIQAAMPPAEDDEDME